MKLLLIEDDTALHTALSRSLTRLGWEVEVCMDGRAALPRWRASHPDVVLLDLTLPGRDGLAVLQQARDEGLTTPVLILTARGTVGDKVQGLNAGADDYLPKPFDLDELEARVRALLRRHSEIYEKSGYSPRESNVLSYDNESKAIYHAGQVLDLSSRELAMLRTLLARAGQAVTKERLFELVFPGQAEVQFEAIEVVAYRLRKKLQGTGATLTTLRGLGYLLKLDAVQAAIANPANARPTAAKPMP
jgi:two-component system, OmpR family, response regulator TctD